MNIDLLVSDLTTDESFVAYPYDDATEKHVQKGYTVEGTVTFGHGLTFLYEDESLSVLRRRAARIFSELVLKLPWVAQLSEPRQRALTDMAFNLGVDGLLEFTTFISLMQSGDFGGAANDLNTTLWAKQVGSRANRIEALIRDLAS